MLVLICLPVKLACWKSEIRSPFPMDLNKTQTRLFSGAFPMFHYQDDPAIVKNLEDDTSKMFPKFALGDGIQSRQGK